MEQSLFSRIMRCRIHLLSFQMSVVGSSYKHEAEYWNSEGPRQTREVMGRCSSPMAGALELGDL